MQAALQNTRTQKRSKKTHIETEKPQIIAQRKNSMRIYTEEEKRQIEPAAIGLLHFLEQTSLLDKNDREWILHQACQAEKCVTLPMMRTAIMHRIQDENKPILNIIWLKHILFPNNRTYAQ